MSRSPSFLLSVLVSSIPLAGASAQVTTTLGTSKDNTLYESPTGTLSNALGSRMFCGTTLSGAKRRAVLAFDVARNIPPCSTIVSVDLVLRLIMTRAGPQQVTLHRVLQDWGEGTSLAFSGQGAGGASTPGDATWIHTFFNTQLWTNQGGDFAATASGSQTVASLGSYTWASTPQMVADVQSWLDNPGSNAGWLLLGNEGAVPTAKAFATKEDPTPSSRPALRITYTEPAASVTSTGTGCARSGAAPLSIATNSNPTIPNPTFALSMSGGPAGPLNAFSFSLDLAQVPIPLGGGCSIYINPLTLIAGVSGNANRVLVLPIQNVTSLLGAKLSVQGVVIDAATALPATSNALTLKLGR